MKKRFLLAAWVGFTAFTPPLHSIPAAYLRNPMKSTLDQNKATVRRFNHEVIEQGNAASFRELMDEHFINHSSPAGADNGPNGMWNTFSHVLRPAFPDMKVIIYEQVAEGDLVTTRKAITGTQSGTLLGIPPSGKRLTIDVIDIVRVRDGKYVEHWGVNTLASVLQQLAKP